MNLLTSFADDDEDEAAGKIKSETENVDEDETGTWVGEYQRGCDWEIYSTTLADMFEGVQFAALSEVLYQKLGLLLFTQSLTHPLSYLLTYSLTYRYCPICITSRRFEERQRKLPCVLKSRPICNPGKWRWAWHRCLCPGEEQGPEWSLLVVWWLAWIPCVNRPGAHSLTPYLVNIISFIYSLVIQLSHKLCGEDADSCNV